MLLEEKAEELRCRVLRKIEEDEDCSSDEKRLRDCLREEASLKNEILQLAGFFYLSPTDSERYRSQRQSRDKGWQRENRMREMTRLLVRVRDTVHTEEEAQLLDETLTWTMFECIIEAYWYRTKLYHRSSNSDAWEGVLPFDGFRALLKENRIHFPLAIGTEIDIRDKGDAFAKAIALLQITWFIIQLIARRVQGLTITELELTTAALAGLNGLTYVFWWNKPRGVQSPVVIRTKCAEKLVHADMSHYIDGYIDETFEINNPRTFKLVNYATQRYVLLPRNGLNSSHSYSVVQVLPIL